MLRRMFNSCANVTKSHKIGFKIILVENGDAIYGQQIAAEYSDRLTINYINEPELGLVCARNAAIEAFLKTDCDWMASLDDDGAVLEGWLNAYLHAIELYPDAKAFAGPTPQIEMASASPWFQRKKSRDHKLGGVEWDASTANALFHRSLFDETGPGLRFDPRFNLSGGEDTRLFRQLKHLDIPVLWVPDAIILEKTDETRGKFANRFRRATQFSQNRGKIAILEHGIVLGLILNLGTSLLSLINAGLQLPAGLLTALVKQNLGQQIFSNGMRMFAQALGRLKAVFRPLGGYYMETDGK